MRGSIAEARRINNGVFGTTSLRKLRFPRKRAAQKNASPLKLFSPFSPTAELGLGCQAKPVTQRTERTTETGEALSGCADAFTQGTVLVLNSEGAKAQRFAMKSFASLRLCCSKWFGLDAPDSCALRDARFRGAFQFHDAECGEDDQSHREENFFNLSLLTLPENRYS